MATIAETLGLVEALRRQGRVNEATTHLRQALIWQPDSGDLHTKLGTLLILHGKQDEALAHYQQALRIWPTEPTAHSNVGMALAGKSMDKEAEAHFREALRLDPNFPEGHNNLGVNLRAQGKTEEARGCFQEALRLKPDYVEAYYNLGNWHKDQKQYDEAVARYQQALRINPDHANVHNNLGSVLQSTEKFDEAAIHYRHALRLNRDHAEAHRNLGTVLQSQAKYDEAMAHFEEAVRIRPGFAEARTDRALMALLKGDFQRGWPEYEWRWKMPRVPNRSFTQPLWDGSPLGKRTILLHAEQGLGDTLFFVRYAPLVKQRGGTVIVECPAALLGLLAGVEGIDQLVAHDSPLPAFDVHSPLATLPGIFHTVLETIPATVPYVSVSAERIERWKAIVHGEAGSLFRVGIVWQGNPKYSGDRQRSIPLAQFERLAELEEVRLFSLQKGHGTDQLADLGGKFPVVDLESRLGDDSESLANIGAVVKNLDLVVTCDTAIGHLAGAMGAAVWTALPHVPDWRWMLQREDSPWYPTMRLFRQTSRGRWDDVIERMAEELRQLLCH